MGQEEVNRVRYDADPALYAIRGRATSVARTLTKITGRTVAAEWVMVELNYRWLVAVLRAQLGPDGVGCVSCGQPFLIVDGRPKIHLDHVQPPRPAINGVPDYPRYHARNLQVLHAGENLSKRDRDYDESLDLEQREWQTARGWANHAGTKGWPPYTVAFGRRDSQASPVEVFTEQLTFDVWNP
jgi:hypothetical protein